MTSNDMVILKMRRQAMSYKDIAKATGLSCNYIGHVCRANGLGNPAAQEKNQETKIAETIKAAGYEYIGGYTRTHENVTVRCPTCGETFERRYHIFRSVVHGTWNIDGPLPCPMCKRKETEAQRKALRDAQNAKKSRKQQERIENKALADSRMINELLMERLAIHECETCGRQYCIEITGYNSRKFCSRWCQQNKYRRGHDKARMKRMYGKSHDNNITLSNLYERDHGTCYLCGRQCDWNDATKNGGVFVAGKRYPTIDHVVPLASGGLHKWENVKLACMECNTRKGAGPSIPHG